MWVKCAQCGKQFWAGPDWGYKGKKQTGTEVFFCRWNHKRAWETKHTRKVQGKGSRKRVQCVETGEVYPSGAEASRQMGVKSGYIHRACRTGGVCIGRHWIYLEDETP